MGNSDLGNIGENSIALDQIWYLVLEKFGYLKIWFHIIVGKITYLYMSMSLIKNSFHLAINFSILFYVNSCISV